MKRHAKTPHASSPYSEEFKRSVVAQLINKKPAELAAEHKVHVSRIYDWKKKYANGSSTPPNGGNGADAAPVKRTRNTPSGLSEDQKRAAVAELNAGGKAKEIAAKNHVSEASVYAWRKKFRSGGALVPVDDTPHKVSVFRTGKKNGVTVIADAIGVHDATIFLNMAAADLDGVRPRDLSPFELKVLQARSSLRGE